MPPPRSLLVAPLLTLACVPPPPPLSDGGTTATTATPASTSTATDDDTTAAPGTDTTAAPSTDSGGTQCLGIDELLIADLYESLCGTADLYSCDGARTCSMIACNLGPADPGGWVRQVDPAIGEDIDVSPAVEMGTIADDGSRVTADIVVSVVETCSPRFVTRAVCSGAEGCDATVVVRIFDAAGDFSAPVAEHSTAVAFDGAATEIDIDLTPVQDIPQLYIELAISTGVWSAEDVLLLQQPRVIATN